MGAWVVVVPVKPLAVAKSRLALDDPLRHELALAFTADTIRAVSACAEVRAVVVVTDDVVVAAAARQLGARVVADLPAEGLNAALEHGAEVATSRYPGCAVAAVAGDLPALRPADLADVLRRAALTPMSFVPDATSTGTTVFCGADRSAFRPEFGPGSAALHAKAGAMQLDAAAGVRRDVDTVGDLRLAVALGVGPSTAAVLSATSTV